MEITDHDMMICINERRKKINLNNKAFDEIINLICALHNKKKEDKYRLHLGHVPFLFSHR